MSAVEQETLEAQRQRRKRINRMKSMIVLTIAVWMLASFFAIVILSVCMGKLNHRVHVLENIVNNQKVPQRQEDPLDSDLTENEQLEISETENVTILEEPDYSNVVRGIDTEDNMATEGDIHKVYLTFDSVPGENSIAIMDLLDTYQLKATFFVSGNVEADNYEIVKRMSDDGHTIGMHSFSNQYSTIYASKEAFEEDYNRIYDFLLELTGSKSKYYRFPGGSGNEISNVDMAEFVHILNENSISFYDWNVSAGDAASDYLAEDVVHNVLEGVSKYKTSVVLLHDASDKSTTVEALSTLIEQLQAMNAQILPIDENTTLIQYIKADSVE